MRLWNSLQGVGFNFWARYENLIRNQLTGSSICHDECTLLTVMNKPFIARRQDAKQATWTYKAKVIVNIWQNELNCAIARISKSFKGTNMAPSSGRTCSVRLQRIFGPSLSAEANWYAVSTDWFYYLREFMASEHFRLFKDDSLEVSIYDLVYGTGAGVNPCFARQERKILWLWQHYSILWAELYIERM